MKFIKYADRTWRSLMLVSVYPRRREPLNFRTTTGPDHWRRATLEVMRMIARFGGEPRAREVGQSKM